MNSLFHTVKRDEEDKIKRLGLGNIIFLLNYLGLVSLGNDYNLIFEHKKSDENKNSSIFYVQIQGGDSNEQYIWLRQ